MNGVRLVPQPRSPSCAMSPRDLAVDTLQAIQKTWPADPADWWLPPQVEPLPRPARLTGSRDVASYTNYRYWPELCRADTRSQLAAAVPLPGTKWFLCMLTFTLVCYGWVALARAIRFTIVIRSRTLHGAALLQRPPAAQDTNLSRPPRWPWQMSLSPSQRPASARASIAWEARSTIYAVTIACFLRIFFGI